MNPERRGAMRPSVASPSRDLPSPGGLELTVGLPPAAVELLAVRVVELLADRLPAAGPVREPWLTTAEAAEHLRCPVSRIHDLVALGRVHPHRDGRRLLFHASDLDAALEG